jgi:exodeoxyribonuclease VII small subunit
MAADPEQAPEQAPAYEAAREELLDVVRQLEAGGLPLEKSLSLWVRVEELSAICQNWLDGARARLSARRPDQNSDDESDDAG